MQWSPIKILVLSLALISLFVITAPSVLANIPEKAVCIKNDKDQPLLFNGQGFWVRQNNATGTLWFKQADANGCAVFNSDNNFQKEWFKKDNNVDMNFDGAGDGSTLVNRGNGDMGCASGPFGFKVVMPKEMENDWKCETVGTANAQFPCCRSPEEQAGGGCNVCQTSTQGYEGEQTQKQCYCDRSAHNGGLDADCPICFHNDGVTINVVLHCKKTKTTESKSLEKPAASQFASKQNQALSCLNTEICSETDPLRKCQPNVNTASGTRRVLLRDVKQRKQTLLPSEPNKPFWLVECVIEGAAQENASYLCTTGSSANDVTALGVDNFSKLKGAYGYSSTIYTQDGKTVAQPILTTQDLLDTYEWETTTSKLTSSVFMGVYDQGATGAATVGSSSGQQQATLSFEDACTLVQDPFGHVFDSHTLEPLANASVEITQKNAKGNFEKLASQETGKSGGYSFYVKDGTYRITASKANYTFPGTAANLNKNASMFYSNLYHGEDIIQNGRPEQRDIPLDPLDKKAAELFAQTNPIEFVNYFQTFNKADKTFIIEGQVSHPRSLVVAYAAKGESKDGQLVKSRAIKRTESDNSGFFKLIIPLPSLYRNEVIGELEAVKKTTQSKTSVKLNPLLDSIEGYAYDSTGRTVPGAIVEVMTPVSTRPYFTTRADTKGYFSIPSEKVPPVQVSLRFVKTNNTVENINTRTFIAQNSTDSNNYANIAKAGEANGNVLGINTKSDESIKPAVPAHIMYIAFLLLAIIVGSVYKVYIRK
jgi:hypothetical protein